MTAEPICFRSFSAARAHSPASLPENPDILAGYHRAATGLLAMLAERVEPDWAKAEKALAEIDRLLALQASIVAHVARRPAGSLSDVLAKLKLWSASRGDSDDEHSAEDDLVRSALQDLQRLLAA